MEHYSDWPGQTIKRAAPLVSVIIPCYNGARTLKAAVDSALCQEVSLEVLVVNDCSTDETEAVLEGICRADSRVRALKNESSQGAARSRNRAVEAAKGSYVAFLDADDLWEKGKLKKQLSALERSESVLCCTARELMDPEGRCTGRVIPVPERISYRQLLWSNRINCSSVLLRASAAREYPMEHEDSHEDYSTWLKILRAYGPAVGINEPLLKYRLTKKGKSGGKGKSALMTYKVYRYMGFGRCRSLVYFAGYAVIGVWKYLRA